MEELLKGLKEEKSLKNGLSAACEATVMGTENTKGMIAKHGRPSYYDEKSIGKEYPGAAVGVLIMKAFAEYERK